MNPLQAAVQSMERQQPEEALPALEAALEDPQTPPEVAARVMGLRAQALLMLERLNDAKLQCRDALRAARTLNDTRGLQQLRGLNGQIYAALAHAAEQRRLHDEERAAMGRSLEELLGEATDDAARAMVYIRRASFLADEGDDVQARASATEGLRRAETAGGVRERVLALLCMARVDRHQAERCIRAAHAVADEAEEAQLIAAIARAARAEGVDLFSPR
jgi:hypothetical protein